MNKKTIAGWVEKYQKAWQTNAPRDVARLFAKDAAYYPDPFAEPWRGREGIVKEWMAHADAPGDYTFRYEVIGTGKDSGIVRGWTTYKHPAREFSNIWLIRFDAAGRCVEFTEWWKQRPKSRPAAAGHIDTQKPITTIYASPALVSDHAQRLFQRTALPPTSRRTRP